MKKLIVIATVLFLTGCAGIGKEKVKVKEPLNSQPEVITITITKNSFSPSKVDIKVHDKVVFFNEDEALHQIAISGKAGIPLKKGESWTYGFDSAGIYEISDVFNEKIVGEVDVR